MLLDPSHANGAGSRGDGSENRTGSCRRFPHSKFGIRAFVTDFDTLQLRQGFYGSILQVIALGIPDAIRLSRREFGNLVNEARKIFLGGFKRVVDWASSSEFLALSQKGVELLLESEELEAADEEHVFGAVITWLSSNLDGLASKQEAMRSLARSIRFGCMRGEFLEREVLAMPEMRSVEVEALVREALSFRAWSDEEKLRACAERRFRERKGVADSNFEIFFTAELDDIGTSKRGPVVRWAKRDWWINLQMSGDKEPATVGLCLHTSGQVHGGSGQPADKVFVAISVRSWPSGYWALLKKSRSYWEFPQGEKRFRGYGNFFGMSWDEVRSSCYATCTGEVTLKIKLSRA